MNTVRIFSEDICMKFGIDKCATVVLRKGKLDKDNNDLVLSNDEIIKSLDENTSYKYLGMLKTENIKNSKMKEQVTSEYKIKLINILKSKLNAGTLTRTINTWAVFIFRYSAGVIDWTKQELQNIDRKTRKMMTAYKALRPKADVDRLYVHRKDGGRGLMSIQDTIAYEEHSTNFYILNNSNEVMSSIKKRIKINKECSKSDFKVEQKEERKEKWTYKVRHRKFTRQIENFSLKKSWQWLKRGCLKRQTESLLKAAQDQALGTNYRKARIERSRESAKCRMCKEKDETVTHLVSECSKLAQKEYKRRHDKVATAVQLSILKTIFHIRNIGMSTKLKLSWKTKK